jgi:hypothetical protein
VHLGVETTDEARALTQGLSNKSTRLKIIPVSGRAGKNLHRTILPVKRATPVSSNTFRIVVCGLDPTCFTIELWSRKMSPSYNEILNPAENIGFFKNLPFNPFLFNLFLGS